MDHYREDETPHRRETRTDRCIPGGFWFAGCGIVLGIIASWIW
jgi:hypothetical protein